MSPLIKNVTLGADPELFLFDPFKNEFVSAIDQIGGTKYSPRPLELDGFFVQEDNTLVEFNIPASDSEDSFVYNLNTGMELIKKQLPPNLELRLQASAFYPDHQLKDPRALMFGCDPDYNAWLGEMNRPPTCNPKMKMRSAGGHIHVGYELDDKTIDEQDVNKNIIRWMDLFLGVPSIIMDTDVTRRKLYGKAGSYRDKPYGVEYRTLSSFWLGSSSKMAWAYNQTMRAVDAASNNKFIDKILGSRIVQTINVGNKDTASALVSEFQLELA